MIRFLVSTPHVSVTTSHGNVVSSQINLIWKDGLNTDAEKYYLYFLASVPAIGLTTYTIRYR